MKTENTSILTRKRVKKIAFISYCSDLVGMTMEFQYAVRFARERLDCTVSFVNAGSPRCGSPEQFDVGTLTGYDGIFVQTSNAKMLGCLAATGLPVVCPNLRDVPGIAYVDCDYRRMAEQAAEWFLERRFRSFALFSYRGFYSAIIESTFVKVLKDAGFDCITRDGNNIDWTTYFNTNKNNGLTFDALKRSYLDGWIPSLPPKTAVLTGYDGEARLAVETCSRCGRAVPDDIAVMGCGNYSLICQSESPQLTSVDCNVEGVIRAGMQLLLDMIDHPELMKEQKPVFVPPLGVVERESTDTYPVDPPWFAEALKLIDDNIDKPVSPTALAKTLDVSPTTLQTAFHRTFDMTANRYILSTKMREAKRLIGIGKCSVKELAARTGFSSQSYFSRAYTAWYGRSPSEDAAGTKEQR